MIIAGPHSSSFTFLRGGVILCSAHSETAPTHCEMALSWAVNSKISIHSVDALAVRCPGGCD